MDLLKFLEFMQTCRYEICFFVYFVAIFYLKNKQTWQRRNFAKRIIFAQGAANISTKFLKESLWEAPTTDACAVSRLDALEDWKATAEVALTSLS